ncbi:MAG: hypothetical protein KUG78_00995 [Kangiellaceae bacterium]|nr:hypothetical protein [Kangiellaceae bacterium]
MENSAVTDYLNYILVASVVAGLFSFYYLVSFFSRIKRKQLLKSTRKLIGLMFFSMTTGFFSLILIGTQGYQALTHETLAATVTVTPTAEKKFVIRIVYPDSFSETFELSGDEVMFEANIIKWKPWSNIFGLKTAFRLDRVRGRFQKIDDEKSVAPTLFKVNSVGKGNIAEWRESFQHLSLLLDVEHGSASYVSAKQSKVYELFVTTDGLLFRTK